MSDLWESFLRRRALVGVGLSAAAVTVAAASWWRKPPADPVMSPQDPPGGSPAVRLQGADALSAVPPRPLPQPLFQDGAFHDGGGAARSLAGFAGRPVLLNLWASWCLPCVAELPALAALAAREPAGGLAVVALSSDRGGAAVVRGFFAAHRIVLPVYVDPTGAVERALDARGLPTTLLIDAQGRERLRLEGPAAWDTPAMRQRLGALLA